MSTMMKRPGSEMSTRPLHFIWMVDCSGSMSGEKIQSLNYAIRQAIPEMRSAAGENPNAELLVRVLKFSTGAQWQVSTPTPIDQFDWQDLVAEGVTDMGMAFSLVAEQLRIPPMSERALPPVLVLLTDGQPTDSYRDALQTLQGLSWGKKSVRIAIAIGHDADLTVLEEFTGNKELVLQANSSTALVKFIKWASTVAKAVSQPKVTDGAVSGDPTGNIDTAGIPVVGDDQEEPW